MADIYHLHRVASARGTQGRDRPHPAPANLYNRFAESLQAEEPPSTLERIADALASPRFLLFYAGFYCGCIVTVGLAYVWSVAQ